MHCAQGEVGYSLSILEYMSSGLLVLAPNDPSVCQSIDDKQTGHIYQPKDIQSAVNALLTHNSDAAKNIRQQATERVAQHYDIALTNQHLRDIFDKIIPG